MYIKRILADNLHAASQEYPVIAIMGPRQSGKTTLARTSYPDHSYVSLEDFDMRAHALQDPRAFLTKYSSKSGIILDEIQHAPDLLSYIQTIVDAEKKRGFFIVTGSQNFLVTESITQTLAGRMAVLTLLPLSIAELEQANMLTNSIEELIVTGSYPRIYSENISFERLYVNYIQLYIERDVRQIKNIENIALFEKFIRLCAGRIGQVVNYASLANDCGVNQITAKMWIALLEASYIVFQVQPYFNNYGKRLIKSPKLYFVDTGIACSLLKIRNTEQLSDHYLRGGLIESLLIGDLLKQQYNSEQRPSLYFWRDKTGNEIDCIIDAGLKIVPIEIKASATLASDFFKTIQAWNTKNNPTNPSYLIYGGGDDKQWNGTNVIGWQSTGTLIKDIENL